MASSSPRISVDEQARLDACSVEPIRTPGTVQSHGVVLVADASTHLISHVSANVVALLGIEPGDVLGRPLTELIGEGPLGLIMDVLDDASIAANPALIAVAGTPFDAIVHQEGDRVILDLEPSLVHTESQATASLYAAIHRLSRLQSAAELWEATAREVRHITHFDHVMVYHFHDDDHGEIVAEAIATGMEPYLGLHYPSSDIPPQARALYLMKLSRVIADSSVEPVTLLASSAAVAATTVDLSQSELRSVSPYHLQFMRNMGQISTMSFSLVDNGKLIGMITCAHRTARRVPFAVRRGLEILANQVALQLGSIASISALTLRMDTRSVRTELIAELTGELGIATTLTTGDVTMLDLIAGDGAAVCIAGVTTLVGSTPSHDQLALLTQLALERSAARCFVSNALPLDHPELATLAPAIAGMLMVPIGDDGDYIAWFRDELIDSIRWLGDQTPDNRLTPLSPRNSFSEWIQDITGTSASWGQLEIDAIALGQDIESVLFRRSETRLAHVALHDPLTGLPNRRLLMNRLDHALAKYARGEEIALLFIDLDGFKAINDRFGHDSGDGVLVRVAQQISATVRAQDTVSRVGGDEFVVLCESTTAEDAELLAYRILNGIRASMAVLAHATGLTASIGITSGNLSFSATDLLRHADAAMYRAKQSGRDQVSQ